MSLQSEKIWFVILMSLFVLLGGFVAYFVYQYQTITNGILGITVLYLMTSRRRPAVTGGTIEELIKQPKRIQLMFSMAFQVFIMLLAVRVVYRMLVALF